MIDLHVHSTASDGTMTPTEVVREAAGHGLQAIALTDHDTIAGLQEAIEAGMAAGLEVIPGCELSVDAPRGELHILGLWVDPWSEVLTGALEDLRAKRHTRNEEIVRKLRSLGIPIAYDEVLEAAGGDSVGRPHIASVLVAKGVVGSMGSAFRSYLAAGRPGYVPKEKLTVGQALHLLRSDGATTVLAHPFSPGMDESELRPLLEELKGMGLDGVEAYYSHHSERQTGFCLRLAIGLDLVVSGGSDFHGSVKPQVMLGRGTGSLSIPVRILDELKAYRKSKGQWTEQAQVRR
jgi:3',5'-nucleoside bisphosphate phosphatase